MKLLDNIKVLNNTYKEYKEWEKNQKNLEKKRNVLHKNNHVSSQDLKMADSYGRTVIDNVNFMDDYVEAREVGVDTVTSQITGTFERVGLAFGLVSSLGLTALLKGSHSKIKKLAIPIVMSGTITGNMVGTVIGVKIASGIHKNASETAKYEAMNKLFKNPKNFIVYTPDQISEAEEKAKSIELPQEDYKEFVNPVVGFKGCYEATKKTILNRKNYESWKFQDYLKKLKQDKLNEIEITPEQLSDAKQHQAILFRVMNKLDYTSQEYAENVGLAMNLITVGSIVTSFITSKIFKKSLEKDMGKVAPKSLKKLISPLATLGIGLTTSFYSLSLQNEASSVGRYVAKRDLTKDPMNFITYSHEELNKIDIKNNKKTTIKEKNIFARAAENISSNIKILWNYRKDLKEYKEYKNHKELHDKKVREALKSIKTTEEQNKNAEVLQDRTFKIFNEMNQTKHKVIENVNIANEIGKSALISLFSIPAMYTFAKNTSKLAAHHKTKILSKQFIKSASKEALEVAENITISVVLPLTIYEMLGLKAQKNATGISLMNALKNLDDPRNFVAYTDEQHKQADQEVAKTLKQNTHNKQDSNITLNMAEFLQRVTNYFK